MGYKRKRTVYRLKFEDPELEGLEVDTTSASLEEFVAITNLSDLSVLGADVHELTPETMAMVSGAMERLDDLFAAFSKHLVAWNLEDDDDEPVPATYEGVKSQDAEFILELIAAWIEAVGGVSGPKEQRSSGGSPFPEGSLPMETLSSVPPSLGTPSLSSDAVSGSGAFQAS